MTLPKGHLGAIGELSVSNYYIKLGYEVFRNISAHGPGDLIIWRQGETPLVIDVKSFSAPYQRADGEYVYARRAILREDGVYQVIYNHLTDNIIEPHELTRTRTEDPV